MKLTAYMLKMVFFINKITVVKLKMVNFVPNIINNKQGVIFYLNN